MSNATLATVDRALLQQHLSERGEPAYRAGQVWEWAARGATGYEQMTNLPDALRRRLEREVPFSTLELVEEAKASDGTVKALFRTHDGHPVESVLMRYRDGRRSVCLSSQSGCPLTCTFCATGQMRFGRNLTSSEILDQALHFRRIEPIDHAVFMGMGEPMLNLDSVLEAARALPDVGITWRRTTISTVGWLPGLRRFVDGVEEPIRLALSLHAPTVELRRRKVFIEYVMLRGVNDRVEQARALADLLDPKVFKVNLIPFTFTPIGSVTRYESSTRKGISAFKDVLERAGIATTVRLNRGRDIQAACGQLAAIEK